MLTKYFIGIIDSLTKGRLQTPDVPYEMGGQYYGNPEVAPSVDKFEKYKKQLQGIEEKFQEYGAPAVIFIFSFLPLPFDIVGIFCGIVDYPPKKFFIPLLIGKVLKYLIIAYAGFLGIGWISQYFVVE